MKNIDVDRLWEELCYDGILHKKFWNKGYKYLAWEWIKDILGLKDKTKKDLSNNEIIQLHSRITKQLELL